MRRVLPLLALAALLALALFAGTGGRRPFGGSAEGVRGAAVFPPDANAVVLTPDMDPRDLLRAPIDGWTHTKLRRGGQVEHAIRVERAYPAGLDRFTVTAPRIDIYPEESAAGKATPIRIAAARGDVELPRAGDVTAVLDGEVSVSVDRRAGAALLAHGAPREGPSGRAAAVEIESAGPLRVADRGLRSGGASSFSLAFDAPVVVRDPDEGFRYRADRLRLEGSILAGDAGGEPQKGGTPRLGEASGGEAWGDVRAYQDVTVVRGGVPVKVETLVARGDRLRFEGARRAVLTGERDPAIYDPDTGSFAEAREIAFDPTAGWAELLEDCRGTLLLPAASGAGDGDGSLPPGIAPPAERWQLQADRAIARFGPNRRIRALTAYARGAGRIRLRDETSWRQIEGDLAEVDLERGAFAVFAAPGRLVFSRDGRNTTEAAAVRLDRSRASGTFEGSARARLYPEAIRALADATPAAGRGKGTEAIPGGGSAELAEQPLLLAGDAVRLRYHQERRALAVAEVDGAPARLDAVLADGRQASLEGARLRYDARSGQATLSPAPGQRTVLIRGEDRIAAPALAYDERAGIVAFRGGVEGRLEPAKGGRRPPAPPLALECDSLAYDLRRERLEMRGGRPRIWRDLGGSPAAGDAVATEEGVAAGEIDFLRAESRAQLRGNVVIRVAPDASSAADSPGAAPRVPWRLEAGRATADLDPATGKARAAHAWPGPSGFVAFVQDGVPEATQVRLYAPDLTWDAAAQTASTRAALGLRPRIERGPREAPEWTEADEVDLALDPLGRGATLDARGAVASEFEAETPPDLEMLGVGPPAREGPARWRFETERWTARLDASGDATGLDALRSGEAPGEVALRTGDATIRAARARYRRFAPGERPGATGELTLSGEPVVVVQGGSRAELSELRLAIRPSRKPPKDTLKERP